MKKKYLKSDKLNCRLVLTVINVCEITEEAGMQTVNFFQIFNVNDIWNFDQLPDMKDIERLVDSRNDIS